MQYGNILSFNILFLHLSDSRYCISLDNSWPFAKAENMFFSKCNIGRGKIYNAFKVC